MLNGVDTIKPTLSIDFRKLLGLPNFQLAKYLPAASQGYVMFKRQCTISLVLVSSPLQVIQFIRYFEMIDMVGVA